MLELRRSCDLDECQRVWERLVRLRCVFDCWDVRACFHRRYENAPAFGIASRDGRPVGLLPLSWIADCGYYGYFPGETWSGKTWLEQSRVPADSHLTRRELMRQGPEPVYLRYLTSEATEGLGETTLDETGYLFCPPAVGFSMEAYWQQFSGKSRKKLGRELDAIDQAGLEFRVDCVGDTSWMFEENLRGFGERSYFHDERFLGAFEDLLGVLQARGWLRVTSALIGGRFAAVDVGAVVGDTYTVLAGATDAEFPGIAKAINLFHMSWACRRRIAAVDFLCGDFGWKERFHLQPRPLFALGQLPAHLYAEAVEAVDACP